MNRTRRMGRVVAIATNECDVGGLSVRGDYLLALMLADAVAAQSDPVPLMPLSSLIGKDDFPATALKQSATGSVDFRLAVDANGKPDGCTVQQTSGSKDLDEATCAVMLTRARFAPAIDRNGTRIRGTYAGRVRWAIEDDPIPWMSVTASIRVAINADGTFGSCSGGEAIPGASIATCSTSRRLWRMSWVVP